jgi:hypothetical protein
LKSAALVALTVQVPEVEAVMKIIFVREQFALPADVRVLRITPVPVPPYTFSGYVEIPGKASY